EGAIKSVANIINSKGFSEVRSEMAKYNKVTIEENGKERKVVSPGLANRRKFEADMFDSKIKSCPKVSQNCNGG
ncbi:28476_t:CDS:1, partial [Racocetra persica]